MTRNWQFFLTGTYGLLAIAIFLQPDNWKITEEPVWVILIVSHVDIRHSFF